MRFPLLAAIRKSFLKSYRRFKKNKTRRQYQFSFVASVMIGLFTIGYLNCGKNRSLQENQFSQSSIKHVFLETKTPISKDEKRFGKNQMMFDAAIVPFEETKQGKEYIRKFGKPAIYDASGYPPISTYYDKFKNKLLKKSSLNSYLIDRAYADDPGELPGQVNCRENETISGYFEAFFEDVAAGTGVGYDDPTFGQARRDGVCEVLKEIATLIKLDQTNVTPDIVFAITPVDMPTNALAAASTYFGFYLSPISTNNGFIYNYILTQQDPSPMVNDFDAFVYTNFQVSWSVDSSLNENTYDFHTVMWHEILHTLGFMSSLAGNNYFFSPNLNHNIFSEHLYSQEPSSTNNRFFSFEQELSPTLQAPNGTPSEWFINNTSIYQGKKNIVNATMDGPRPLYSPINWEQGSSLSHFDMQRAPGIEYVMNPSVGTGIDRQIHEHEKELLCHLGYQVQGVSDCELPTPVANHDILNMTSLETSFCIPIVENDISFSGGNLSIESFEVVDLPSSIQMHFDDQTTNCTGSNVSNNTNPIGAKSISFENPNFFPFTLKYRVKDSASNRISSTALIHLSTCNNALNEYVCNGNFELGPVPSFQWPPGWNAFFSKGAVPYWGDAFPSADLVRTNSYNFHLNLPYTYDNGVTIDTIEESLYSAFMSVQSGYNERITTKLKTPLEIGATYTMSFDMIATDMTFSIPSNIVELNIQGALSTQNTYFDETTMPYWPFPEYLSASPIVASQSLTISHEPGLATWTHFEQPFVATEPFEYFFITSQVEEGYFAFYVDNVSIKKNAISGFVYNDVNGNGIQDSSEPGIAGVTIGLFSNVDGNLVQTVMTSDQETTLGKYVFNPIPDLPDPGYFIGIMPESNYFDITQPASNSLLNGYSHAIQVLFSSGGDIINQNFGILLNPPLCVGDFNENGYVSVDDMLILIAGFSDMNYVPLDYNGDGIPGPSIDMDGNGIVGSSDLNLFLAQYGQTTTICNE